MIIKIPKGKHTAMTLGRGLLRVTPVCKSKLKKKSLAITGEFLSDPYNTQSDEDLRYDWSKFGGLNLNILKEANINSIMLAFRANDTDNVWELALYANKDKTIIFPDEFVSVAKNEKFYLKIDQIDSLTYIAGLYLVDSNDSLVLENEFKFDTKLSIGGIIGPYHGGKDDNNNNLGGVAPEDVLIRFNYTYI